MQSISSWPRSIAALALTIGMALGGPLQAAQQAPAHSAPPSFFHTAKLVVRRDLLRLRAKIGHTVLKTVGYLELAGLRFPVKPYQAQVSGGLWRGSRLGPTGLVELKARGFRSVITLTAERNLDAAAKQDGLRQAFIPIIDNNVPSRAQVAQFLSFASAPQNQPAYVHCEAGVGRTGIMVAAYRIAVEGWSPGKAVVEARKYGMVNRAQIEFIRTLGQDGLPPAP